MSWKLQGCWAAGLIFTLYIFSGQIIATSHDLTSNGGLVREIPLFQGNLGWWNIIVWPDIFETSPFPPVSRSFCWFYSWQSKGTKGPNATRLPTPKKYDQTMKPHWFPLIRSRWFLGVLILGGIGSRVTFWLGSWWLGSWADKKFLQNTEMVLNSSQMWSFNFWISGLFKWESFTQISPNYQMENMGTLGRVPEICSTGLMIHCIWYFVGK